MDGGQPAELGTQNQREEMILMGGGGGSALRSVGLWSSSTQHVWGGRGRGGCTVAGGRGGWGRSEGMREWGGRRAGRGMLGCGRTAEVGTSDGGAEQSASKLIAGYNLCCANLRSPQTCCVLLDHNPT